MSDRKLVAIAVPLSDRDGLLPEEEVSLRHLRHHLGGYDAYLIAPPGRDPGWPGFGRKEFPGRFFGSAEAHKRLLLSRRFYEAFADYRFLLIHHLDALVFSDRLVEWCERGYDYVAAPWLEDRADPSRGFWRVGNGGFSLRRIPSFLEVFDSRRLREEPEEYWERCHAGKPWPLRALHLPKKWLKRFRWANGVRRDMRQYRWNEDYFWSMRAPHYVPEFRVAPVEEALEFAFECAPRYCFERNGRRLPFGCHAWERWDREFWEPYLLEGGERDPAGAGREDGGKAGSRGRGEHAGASRGRERVG